MRTFVARFEQDCEACGDLIEEGEEMSYGGGMYICLTCAEEAEADGWYGS